MTQAYNLSQFANFLNTSGQVSAAGIQSGVVLASGTVSLYYQASAPTGWTQVTSLNDYDLRLVSSGGGTTGGTTAYSTVFTNQTVTTSISGTTGATTLSTSQIPSHTHDATGGFGGVAGVFAGGNPCCGTFPLTTGANSGGGGSHTHSFSGSGTSSAVVLNVRYANIILCSKN